METITTATASQLYQEGKYQEALHAYHKLAQTNPTAENYMGLAQTYKSLGYIVYAVETLNEGIAHNPQNLDLKLMLAQIHFSSHNLDSVKEILEPIYEANKENLVVSTMYLNYFIAVGDYEKGKMLIPFLKKKGSNHAGILNNIGLVYIETGDMRSAMENFRKGF